MEVTANFEQMNMIEYDKQSKFNILVIPGFGIRDSEISGLNCCCRMQFSDLLIV